MRDEPRGYGRKRGCHWGLLLAVTGVSLAGCAAAPSQQPPHPTPVAATSPVAVIIFTQAALKQVESHAYERGFAAGRDWALRHPQSLEASPSPKATLSTPKLGATAKTPTQAPTQAPALPTGQVYELSGPARPLSP